MFIFLAFSNMRYENSGGVRTSMYFESHHLLHPFSLKIFGCQLPQEMASLCYDVDVVVAVFSCPLNKD